MRLFIAEKPAMARSIAKNLPGPHVNKDGYIETGGGYVSWCIGHLLETAPPDAYDPKYEKFPGNFSDLPLIPNPWIVQISGDKKKQVDTIKGLIKKATEIVHAGDPGREGQLIVDELLEFLGNRKPVLRILLHALDDTTIKKALNNLVDNRQYASLYDAGKGRQRADFLIGMNMSRAYSIIGQSMGYRGVLSVGRVQSPTLAIVVRRDREIASFIPKDYWTIKGSFSTPQLAPPQFWMNWLPPGLSGQETDEEDDSASPSHSYPWMDDKHRIIDVNHAQAIVAKVQGKMGTVTEADRKRVQEPPPLPFDLAQIQMLANSKWGTSIQDTLNVCQSLYEKGFTSYPRTDCRYLPESQLPEVPGLLQSLAKALPHHSALIQGANPQIKSRAWDDHHTKEAEHHAIIPTLKAPDFSQLTSLEKDIYQTIALQFLAQFYPSAEVDKTKLVIEVEGERFLARGRSIASPGWRSVFGQVLTETTKPDAEAVLPMLQKGDTAPCIEALLEAKKTTPPSHYTQGTLLDAMKKVHTLVSDPVVKKKLKSVEGIGRSATRAAIIENLMKKGFLIQHGKQLTSSDVGKALVDALPPKIIDPALTALWETALDSVATGQTSLDAFMLKQHDWIIKLVQASKGATIQNLPQGYSTPAPGKSSSKSSSASSVKKAPAKVKGAPVCPQCKKGQLIERTAKSGPNAGKTFLGCNNYPNCKHAEPKK